MEDMDAMILACVRHIARTGTVPPRDLVIVFFADEEAGGTQGLALPRRRPPGGLRGRHRGHQRGGWLQRHPDRPGWSERRAYLLQTAEKGIAWLRLTARGRAGHGSVPNDENAIVRLAEAIARIAAHKWPREYIPSVRTLLDGCSQLTGTELVGRGPRGPARPPRRSPGVRPGRFRTRATSPCWMPGTSTTSSRSTPPRTSTAGSSPAHEEEVLATIRDLAGEHVDVEVLHGHRPDAPFEGELVDAMVAALRTEDPDADVLPYCLSGGTDNKALSLLGITGYGFAPAPTPGRPRLRADVPRDRRARAGGVAPVRCARADAPARDLLTHNALPARPVSGEVPSDRRGRMIFRRNHVLVRPPTYVRVRSSSHRPYSACSVSARRMSPRWTSRPKDRTRYSYSTIATLCPRCDPRRVTSTP